MSARLRLVAFDIEGTLTVDPTIWEIMHRKLGSWESHGDPYWQRFRRGEFDYDTFARMDVACWKGSPHSLLVESAREVRCVPGCREVMEALHSRNIVVCAISCGLDTLSQRLSVELGIERHFANSALHGDGRLSGDLQINVPYGEKGHILGDLLQRLGIAPENAASVGDHAMDISMFRTTGFSVAFNTSDPAVGRAATRSVHSESLAAVLDHLPI